jgi:hypothetical protein
MIEGRMVRLPALTGQRDGPTRLKVLDVREVALGVKAEIGREVARIMEEQGEPENGNQAK